jgi:predicted DNA-binding transcriptional regulator AlpA
MITAPNAAHSFGNSWNKPAYNQHTVPTTDLTYGNGPAPQTPTYHPALCCSCAPSLNDSDGKPNTPPPNSPPATHHPTTVRQLAIKPPKEKEAMDPSTDENHAADLVGGRWYSTEELATLLGVDASSVRRWRTSRPPQGPPFVKLSSRVTVYSAIDVAHWLRSRRVDPGRAA